MVWYSRGLGWVRVPSKLLLAIFLGEQFYRFGERVGNRGRGQGQQLKGEGTFHILSQSPLESSGTDRVGKMLKL